MEHGEIVLDLELMDRIDLHGPIAVCVGSSRCADLSGSCPAVSIERDHLEV